ncbi:hypothetical protein [Salinibacterium sp. SWN1162]|uniref:hypothetical protein n=1 Tax=Salinibacterium sp. SWN1162 TaxID=2792053 RepID=UPI0018CE7764|nr:hypothetical protein [Salinibacterium sp. SWN1162]MBH0009720.1 hypothetical protein [Salinibacterium sp. SWN1162]
MMGTARLTMMGVLAIAIVANVVQFAGIDEVAPENYEAINRKPSSDIVDISSRSAPVNRAYGLSWAIAAEQPDATVLVSADDESALVSLRAFILGFGEARSVSLASDSLHTLTTLEQLRANPQIISVERIVSDGHGHRLEDWLYIRGDCSDDSAPQLAIGHLPLDAETAADTQSDSGLALVVVDNCLLPNGGLSE